MQVGLAECLPLGMVQMLYALHVGKPELMGSYEASHACSHSGNRKDPMFSLVFALDRMF